MLAPLVMSTALRSNTGEVVMMPCGTTAEVVTESATELAMLPAASATVAMLSALVALPPLDGFAIACPGPGRRGVAVVPAPTAPTGSQRCYVRGGGRVRVRYSYVPPDAVAIAVYAPA